MPSLRNTALAIAAIIARTQAQAEYPDLFRIAAGEDVMISPPESLNPGQMGIWHIDQLAPPGNFSCSITARWPGILSVPTQNGAYCAPIFVQEQVSPDFGTEIRLGTHSSGVLSNTCGQDLAVSSAIVEARESQEGLYSPRCKLTAVTPMTPLMVGEHTKFNATLDQGNVTCYGQTSDPASTEPSTVVFNAYEIITPASGPLLREGLQMPATGAAIDITPENVWNASQENQFMATNLGPNNVVLSCFQVGQKQAQSSEQEIGPLA